MEAMEDMETMADEASAEAQLSFVQLACQTISCGLLVLDKESELQRTGLVCNIG